MTDKPPEERALEQAVIDAALSYDREGTEADDVHTLVVIARAADKLRNFRAPKPKPKCEPADADKDKTWHWLESIQTGKYLPAAYYTTYWIINAVASSIDDTSNLYTYLCVATPPEPKVMPTEEAIEEFVTSHWLKGKAIEIRDIVRETLKHFSLPKPVDLPDADLRKIWLKWLSTRGSDCFSNFEKAARAVLAAGRGE